MVSNYFKLQRLYIEQPLAVNNSVMLDSGQAHYLRTVLRKQSGDNFRVFNGKDGEFLAEITEIGKKDGQAALTENIKPQAVDANSVHLLFAPLKKHRMDFIIEKSVELGVQTITPIFTERCGVKLNPERLAKKTQHWRKVIISACEQCGRNVIPQLNEPVTFDQLLQKSHDWSQTLILNPHKGQPISALPDANAFQIIIGPEGGLSDDETRLLEQKGCQNIVLGPRILRTETAGLAVISVLQNVFGDF